MFEGSRIGEAPGPPLETGAPGGSVVELDAPRPVGGGDRPRRWSFRRLWCPSVLCRPPRRRPRRARGDDDGRVAASTSARARRSSLPGASCPGPATRHWFADFLLTGLTRRTLLRTLISSRSRTARRLPRPADVIFGEIDRLFVGPAGRDGKRKAKAAADLLAERVARRRSGLTAVSLGLEERRQAGPKSGERDDKERGDGPRAGSVSGRLLRPVEPCVERTDPPDPLGSSRPGRRPADVVDGDVGAGGSPERTVTCDVRQPGQARRHGVSRCARFLETSRSNDVEVRSAASSL